VLLGGGWDWFFVGLYRWESFRGGGRPPWGLFLFGVFLLGPSHTRYFVHLRGVSRCRAALYLHPSASGLPHLGLLCLCCGTVLYLFQRMIGEVVVSPVLFPCPSHRCGGWVPPCWVSRLLFPSPFNRPSFRFFIQTKSFLFFCILLSPATLGPTRPCLPKTYPIITSPSLLRYSGRGGFQMLEVAAGD